VNSGRWREIKALLGELIDRPPEQRERFLAEYPHADTDIKIEVAKLLDRMPDLQEFLEPPLTTTIGPPLRTISLAFTGCLIGDYELVDEIGRGASGTVYRAKHVSLGRAAAVKILAHHLCASEHARERFRREAEAASKLRHEAVVSIYSFGEQSGAFYIAMELVTGRNLRDLISDRIASNSRPAETGTAPALDVCDPRVAARLAETLARGLHHCHESRVLHRDVKPENIVIDEQLQPRLIDFGLAKDCALNGLTKTGAISGTPHYMSPEQARAIGSPVDRRTDVYSLGVVLFELLALKRPFEATVPGDLMHAIGHDDPLQLRVANPEVPVDLAAVCMKAIAKRPKDRYPTAAAMADDLRLFLGGKRTRAPRTHAARKLHALSGRQRLLATGVLLIAGLAYFSDALSIHAPANAVDTTRVANPSPIREMREGFEQSIQGESESDQLKHRENFNNYLKQRIRDNEGR